MGFFHVPPPPPVVSAIGAQPCTPNKIAAVTTVPAVVNPPPFTHPARVAANIAVNAQVAQPSDWPVVYVAKRSGQPYAGPLLPDASVKPPDPPFSHPERQTAYIALYAQSAQPSDWPFVYPGERGRQPYAGPLLPDASVKPPDPPFGLRFPIFRADDLPYPQQPQRYVVQGAAPAVAQSPYSDAWLVTVLQAWQSGDYLPTLPRYLVQPFVAPSADNPPFGLLETIYEPWLGDPPLPQLLRRLTPPSVDNPPRLFRAPIQRPDDPPYPQQSRYAVQPFVAPVVNNPPFTNFGRGPYQVIVYSWQPPDPLPTLSNKITPPSVDLPPPFYPLAITWGPDDPLPTLPPKFTPPYRPDNPPFTDFGRGPYQIVGFSWLPPDPLPTLRVKQTPPSVVPAADNPPFGLLETIYEPWLDPWAAFPPYNYRMLAVQPGTATPPPSNPREFTVSGQTVQDLFRPVGSISWNWGGKVSKRTT